MITYSAVLRACEKGQEIGPALILAEGMRRPHVEPNLISFNSAISSCEKDQCFEQAQSVMPEMPSPRLR